MLQKMLAVQKRKKNSQKERTRQRETVIWKDRV